VTRVSSELVPLAKLNGKDPSMVDVYELVINGQEISPGYSELNDPDVQRQRLEHQSGGEANRKWITISSKPSNTACPRHRRHRHAEGKDDGRRPGRLSHDAHRRGSPHHPRCRALPVSSCSTGGRSPSGFLDNYSQLDLGYGTADTVASFLKPGVNLQKYDSVMFDPVTTVVATTGISTEVKEQLAAYLSASLRSQVSGNIRVVNTPGPTTLRVRTAFTDVIEGVKAGPAITTVHSNPQARLSGQLGSAEVAAFVSNVSFEGEILDSVTGERISALIDHRIGVKREATAVTSWASVRSATNQGAARLWKRFETARGN
jgi:hypothetical protein